MAERGGERRWSISKIIGGATFILAQRSLSIEVCAYTVFFEGGYKLT
jgi:hypothetical protein